MLSPPLKCRGYKLLCLSLTLFRNIKTGFSIFFSFLLEPCSNANAGITLKLVGQCQFIDLKTLCHAMHANNVIKGISHDLTWSWKLLKTCMNHGNT